MEQWTEIRRRVLVEQVSQRQILRETGIYWDAHHRAFEFFDGVTVRITYDNDRTLAAEILGAHERKLTEGSRLRPLRCPAVEIALSEHG